jgi:hypothetical protein
MGRKRQQRRVRERQQPKRSSTPPGKASPQRRGGSGGGGRSLTVWAAIVAVVAIVILLFVIHGMAPSTSSTSPTATSPTATSGQVTHRPVDGIRCGAMEQLSYHIHQYLELFDHGKRVAVPAEIGIPGGEYGTGCFYWIHVHAGDPDIIHVESPTARRYTLGTFFDIWEATHSDAIPPGDSFVKKMQAAARNGDLTVFYNLHRWKGSYRSVPLTEHAVITVEIGKPVVPPVPYHSWNGD